MRSQVNRHLESGDWHRTVYIKTLGVGTTEFDLDYEPKRNLEASGRGRYRKVFRLVISERPPDNRAPD